MPTCRSKVGDLIRHTFRSDTPAELELVRSEALAAGADAAVISNHWAEGGAGAKALAEAAVAVCEAQSEFRFLYDLDASIQEKMNIIAREIYRADGVEFSELAGRQIDTYTKQGYGNLPSTSFFLPTLRTFSSLLMSTRHQSVSQRHNTLSLTTPS